MSLIRFFNNVIQPIGGWRERIATQLTGKPRAIRAWRDNDGNRWLGIGTHTKLYALSGGGDLYDITPAGFSTGIADAAGAVGYGVGPYGSYEYGLPRPDSASTNVLWASVWTLDTWGEYLIGCMHGDGVIYEWPLDTVAALRPFMLQTHRQTVLALSFLRNAFCLPMGPMETTARSIGQIKKITRCGRQHRQTKLALSYCKPMAASLALAA
jgi:hypothetical protein